MRQADSTIKGFLYQFNKSIYEILVSEEGASVVLEGVIEDLDIHSTSSIKTIQCKYHEDKKFQISSVASPILEMYSHYCESKYLGKPVSYILYAYYGENVEKIDLDALIDFLNVTKDKEILTKYFHRIYSIPDVDIREIAVKQKKTNAEKDRIVEYYISNRAKLEFREDIKGFWEVFCYIKAEHFDVLKDKTVDMFAQITDKITANELYYPNALSKVAFLSTKALESERTISRDELIKFLEQQKSVLLNQWTIEALDREKILKAKKEHLATAFSSNIDVRAFVFEDAFLDSTGDKMVAFIHEYTNKYYKKPLLQKPPIFILGNNHSTLMQNILLELYKYQHTVNTGMVGEIFVVDSFVNNVNCAPGFRCKLALLKDITVDILERCNVNQLYIVGSSDELLSSPNYSVEKLDVKSMQTIKYLFNLKNTIEE